jgi:hypothetical protein
MRAARDGELDGSAAHASGGATDEQRAAAANAKLVKRARGRLDGDRPGQITGETGPAGRARCAVRTAPSTAEGHGLDLG